MRETTNRLTTYRWKRTGSDWPPSFAPGNWIGVKGMDPPCVLTEKKGDPAMHSPQDPLVPPGMENVTGMLIPFEAEGPAISRHLIPDTCDHIVLERRIIIHIQMCRTLPDIRGLPKGQATILQLALDPVDGIQ